METAASTAQSKQFQLQNHQPGAKGIAGAGALCAGGAAAGTGAGGSDFGTNPFMPAGPLLQAELECKLAIASSCVAFWKPRPRVVS